MICRQLLLAALFFLAPAAAQAQWLSYYPYRGGWGGGSYWPYSAYGNYGGGYYGGGYYGGGYYGRPNFSGYASPFFSGGWYPNSYFGPAWNASYPHPIWGAPFSYTGPLVYSGTMGYTDVVAPSQPRMRRTLQPAISPPSPEAIRAALESK
ncbi:MAG: hypothetical protein HY040_05055 [Planctomycetes bacterium]|nr:hypothetical protein [Planctomycetota bacterium]